MKTVDIRQMSMDLTKKIDKYQDKIESIGYVCQRNTNREKRAVWVKIGYRQRREELNKTRLALLEIEAQILNDGYFDSPECAKRVRRSAAHIYGKGTTLQFNGYDLLEYDSNHIPF